MKKICKCCKEEKHISEYPKNMTYRDGYMSKCKVCWNAYQSSRMKKIRGTDVKNGQWNNSGTRKFIRLLASISTSFNNFYYLAQNQRNENNI